MTETASLVKRLPTDIGGREAEPIRQVDDELEPWEKCGGADPVGRLACYERWIVAFANILFRTGIIALEDLARKLGEVTARWSADAGPGVHGVMRPPLHAPARRHAACPPSSTSRRATGFC